MSTSSTLTLAQISTAYTQSSTHISTEVTTAIQILSSGSHTVQANGSTAMSSETISELPRLSSSTSTCTLRPTTPVISTGEAEKTRHRSNALAPATTYGLVAVGIILTIASTIAAIAAIFCIRKCKCKKQVSRSNHGPTRVASEFIYNSTYERYMDHAGLRTNLRRESTQYHSHWSLTHCDDSDSICYSYPSLEMVEMDNIYNTQGHDGTGNSSAIDTPQTHTSTWLYEGKEVCPRSVVIPNPFQGNRNDGGPQSSKHTARQTSSKRASTTGNSHLEHSQRGKSDKGYTCLYDNPVFKRKQAESDRSAVSVYYSEPMKQVGTPSILLSSNEAYASTNPTSFLLSENEAYKSGHAGGASGEKAYGTSTNSIYYTRPTGTKSEEKDEFGVCSNLAYGQPT